MVVFEPKEKLLPSRVETEREELSLGQDLLKTVLGERRSGKED